MKKLVISFISLFILSSAFAGTVKGAVQPVNQAFCQQNFSSEGFGWNGLVCIKDANFSCDEMVKSDSNYYYAHASSPGNANIFNGKYTSLAALKAGVHLMLTTACKQA